MSKRLISTYFGLVLISASAVAQEHRSLDVAAAHEKMMSHAAIAGTVAATASVVGAGARAALRSRAIGLATANDSETLATLRRRLAVMRSNVRSANSILKSSKPALHRAENGGWVGVREARTYIEPSAERAAAIRQDMAKASIDKVASEKGVQDLEKLIVAETGQLAKKVALAKGALGETVGMIIEPGQGVQHYLFNVNGEPVTLSISGENLAGKLVTADLAAWAGGAVGVGALAFGAMDLYAIGSTAKPSERSLADTAAASDRNSKPTDSERIVESVADGQPKPVRGSSQDQDRK